MFLYVLTKKGAKPKQIFLNQKPNYIELQIDLFLFPSSLFSESKDSVFWSAFFSLRTQTLEDEGSVLNKQTLVQRIDFHQGEEKWGWPFFPLWILSYLTLTTPYLFRIELEEGRGRQN